MNQVSIKLYQTNTRGDDIKHIHYLKYQLVMQQKKTEMHFHPEASVLKYNQNSFNSCCLNSLSSAFNFMCDVRYVTSLVNRIEESLKPHIDKIMNIINFAYTIMTNRMHINREQHLRYNMKVWNKKYDFDILKNINEYLTLVQLMDSLRNVNHTISIVVYSILYSNYEKAIFLHKNHWI